MKKYNKILIIFFLTIFIIYGFFIRSYKLGEQSYWIDEGYTLNAVLSTLEKGYPQLDSGNLYGFNYLLNNYLITGAIKLGGFNPIAVRSISVIFGIGVIFLIYLIGKKLFNNLVGLSAAFLSSFSYWEIAWSRQARMYIQLQFFFFLSFYLFHSLLDKFSYKKLIFVILSTIAAIFSHYLGYFLLVIYALTLIIHFSNIKKEEKQKFWKNKKQKIVLIISGFIILCFIVNLSFDFFSKLQNRDYFFGLNYQKFLLTNLGIIVISALIGFIIGIIKEKNIKKILSLGGAYLIPYLIIIFSVNTVHFRYLFFILPILFIFSGYLIYFIAKKFKYPSLVISLLLIALITSSNVINSGTFIFKVRANYNLEPFTPQPNFKGAYDEIKRNGWSNDKVIISPFTQMDKVYLGKSDYWLAINLDGRKLDKSALKEREYYNNAIIISDVDKLKDVINSQHGYIVVDNMALSIRLDKNIIDLIGQQKLIYSDQKEVGHRIWAFAF
jgi:hypothetical protein